jgi:hypothetical protein
MKCSRDRGRFFGAGRQLVLFFAAALSAATGLWTHAQTTDADAGYETQRLRDASEILPPEMVRGKHHQVLDGIPTYDSMHLFMVSSDYGDFEADGELMLRIRLREISALARLEKESGTTVGARAAGRTAIDSVKSIGGFIARPKKTVKGWPGKVSRRYDDEQSGQDETDTAKKPSKAGSAAKAAGKAYVGMERAQIRWAARVGVDPYSTNQTLREELRRVAGIDSKATMGARFAVPKIPGVPYMGETVEMIWKVKAVDLLDTNRRRLLEIGVDTDLVDEFLALEALTPSLQTLLIGALAEMNDVAERHMVIEQATTLKYEPEALFFVECVVMANWFHTTQSPLDHMVGGTGIPAAVTKDGRLVVFSGADSASWTREAATVAVDFTRIYEGMSEMRELWLSGTATPRFVSEVENLGWSIRSGVRQEILPRIPWGME